MEVKNVLRICLLSSLAVLVCGGLLQSFHDVGTFQHHVSYGHLGLELDFRVFRQRMVFLEKHLTSTVNGTRLNSFARSSLSRLAATLRHAVRRMDEYEQIFLHQNLRPRRQALALLGVGMSCLSMYEIETLKATVSEMKSRQNLLVRTLRSVTNQTVLIEKNVQKLRGAIDIIAGNVETLGHVTVLEAAVIGITEETTGFFLGLEALLAGRVTLSLVSGPVVKKELADLQSAASLQGYDLVFPDHSQLYQLPASFYMESDILNVVVPVPLVPFEDKTVYQLFRYRAIPMLIHGRLVSLKSDNEFIAISKDKSRFVEVTSAMLSGCLHVGRTFLCTFPSFTVTEDFSFCLKDIFLGDSVRVMKSCTVTFHRNDFMFQRVNGTSFAAFANTSVMATQTCGSTVSQSEINQFVIRSVPAGCSVQINSVTFIAEINPVIAVTSIITSMSEDMFGFMNSSSFKTRVGKALENWESVDLQTLRRGERELGALEPWEFGGLSWEFWVVIILSLIHI